MSQSYIFATQLSEFVGARAEQKHIIQLKDFKKTGGHIPNPSMGDHVLVLMDKAGVYESLIPHTFKVTSVTSTAVTFDLDQSYINPVPVERVRTVLSRALSNGANILAGTEYEALSIAFGNPRIAENKLLEHIKKYVAARGYYFDDESIFNYHICLKTRPFVILAGLSGTGKSKLSQIYAEAMGHTAQNERYLRLAVRPSWNDDRFLLGYLNSITGEYVTEPAVDFVIQAEKDRENLYFFCLDEMNLAHVEYYFSQFLSALEEESPADRKIPLFSKETHAKLLNKGQLINYDRVLLVPSNLLFTGTINVDETTQPLSDKVIDRANTIEFFEVELDKIPERRPPPEPFIVSAPMWHSYVVSQPDLSYRSQIIEIGKILNRAGLGLGYRVLREIELYLANASNILKPEVAFDLQVKQRILPRVRGTLAIQSMLTELLSYTKKQNLARSGKRLEEMEGRLKRDGYTSFWR